MDYRSLDRAKAKAKKLNLPYTDEQIETVFNEYFRTIRELMTEFTAPAIMLFSFGTFVLNPVKAFKRMLQVDKALSRDISDEQRLAYLEELDYLKKIVAFGTRYKNHRRAKNLLQPIPELTLPYGKETNVEQLRSEKSNDSEIGS